MFTLSKIMQANAISCIGFGAIFIFKPSEVSSFLSASKEAPSLVITILGIGLFINGLHLIWATSKPTLSKHLITYFSIGDFIWVISTTWLMLAGIWITTSEGIFITISVSGIVGAFGLLQMLKKNEMGNR